LAKLDGIATVLSNKGTISNPFGYTPKLELYPNILAYMELGKWQA